MRSSKRLTQDILRHVVLAILVAIWLVPIVWLVVTSFSAYNGRDMSHFFPQQWTLAQYAKLFTPDTVANFPAWFMNTFKVACACCVVSTLFTLMVAYATSFCDFKSRKPLMNLAVILNLFPGVLSMIAVYFILKALGLTNTHLGLILVYSAASGLGYLIAKGFFDTVPRALCEAAKLDGASQARTFFTVIMMLYK